MDEITKCHVCGISKPEGTGSYPDCTDSDGIHTWIDYWYLPDGEPCKHSGCRAHVSHPCEVCGRIACKGEAYIKKHMVWFLERGY